MSEAKFTEGEWVVKGSSMSMGSNYRGSFSVESSVFSGDISEANIANKALIKASPKMYEMLEYNRQAWVNLLDLNLINQNYEKDAYKIIDRIESMLKEARGK